MTRPLVATCEESLTRKFFLVERYNIGGLSVFFSLRAVILSYLAKLELHFPESLLCLVLVNAGLRRSLQQHWDRRQTCSPCAQKVIAAKAGKKGQGGTEISARQSLSCSFWPSFLAACLPWWYGATPFHHQTHICSNNELKLPRVLFCHSVSNSMVPVGHDRLPTSYNLLTYSIIRFRSSSVQSANHLRAEHWPP